MTPIGLAEQGLVPDFLVRLGIRRMLRQRLRQIAQPDPEVARDAQDAFLRELRRGPVALLAALANEQHYEVPPAFFEQILGARLKYSCALWPAGVQDLDEAEERMLELTCRRAGIADGARVLDLGCGWGSLSLWIAERLPHCHVLAVSNSKHQREFILARARERGLANVEAMTADVNAFAPDRRFDRVVSVEMFEHVRNHPLLLSRIASWLEPDGRLFVHHFSHRQHAYPYEATGPDDWMARTFFSGGIMPSDDLLLRCQDDLVVERHWRLNGRHYQKTCEAWLANQDERRNAVLSVLEAAYGAPYARLWFQRWRLFFLACAELFGTHGGAEWWVTHVRMARRGSTAPADAQ